MTDKRHATTLIAAAPIVRRRLVSYAGTHAGPLDDVLGVSEQDAAAGRACAVWTTFSADVEAAGPIAAGQRVGPALDRTGRAVAGGSAGIALTGASGAGAVFTMEILRQAGLSAADSAAMNGSAASPRQAVRQVPPRSRIARVCAADLGTVVCRWGNSAVGTPSTTNPTPDSTFTPVVAQCAGAAATFSAACEGGAQPSDFWALSITVTCNPRVDGQPYTYARVDLGTDGTFANRALCAITLRADGQPRTYVLPRALWGVAGSFVMGTTAFTHVRIAEQGSATALTLTAAPVVGATSGSLNANFAGGATNSSDTYPVRFSTGEVRYAQLTNGSAAVSWPGPLTLAGATTALEYATTRLRQQAGDAFQAGAPRVNPRGRPMFMIRFDDSLVDQIVPRVALVSPFVGLSGVTIQAGVPQSMLTVLQAFGLKAASFILTRHIGNTAGGFLTESQLRELQDVHGWEICGQSHANPCSQNNLGLRLLGPMGYYYQQTIYGGIQSVAANVVTTVNPHQVVNISGNAGVQGFPVEILGPTSPSSQIAIGQRVWLRNPSSTTLTLHPTEADAAANTNAHVLDVGGASWGMRYWGSATDGSAIAADFDNWQNAMQAMGLNGWRHYALNQGAMDVFVEQAVLALKAQDRIRMAQGTLGASGVASSSFVPMPEWGTLGAGVGFAGGAQGGAQLGTSLGHWLSSGYALSTEGTAEADIRIAVDAGISRGAFGSSYHHLFGSVTSLIRLMTLCDHLKLRQDQGLIDVVLPSQWWAMVEDARAG